MVEIAVPYGRSHVAFSLPDTARVVVVKPASVPGVEDQAGEVTRALDNALAERPLPTEGDAVVVVSDPTRPVPNKTILPVLLDRMESAGIARERITILVASGLHEPASEAALRELIGDDLFERYKVVPHDACDRENLVDMGTTTRGTPIWVNSIYAHSKIRVLTGLIEPHHFAGFAGGWKSLAVGVAGAETIAGSHALLLDPRSDLGVYEGNPTRAEIDEIGSRVGAELAVNVIVNNEKQIVAALAGTPDEVERAGVEMSARITQVSVPHEFDVVVASPGGYPKDRNMYQAQKAVAHATGIVRRGGTIILVAECPEGSGNEKFEEWMAAASSAEEVVERLGREGFQMGAHKAFLLARSMVKARVLLVSDRMPLELGKKLMLEQYTTVESALESTLARHGLSATVAVMPKASSTVPRVVSAA